jgi:hypothetical protein
VDELSRACDGSANRLYASAGGAYPLEILCLLDRIDGRLGGTVAYYNHHNHSASVVGPLPGWDDLAEIVNLKLMEGSPQLVFLFVLPPDRSTAQVRRARRAHRAAGAGHAAQNLALRLVAAGMVYEVGGLLDGTTAQVALGYACGLPVSPRKAIFCAADR